MNYDFGMVGLGTMGRSLALNIADHGFRVAGFDIDSAKAQSFTEAGSGDIQGFDRLEAFVQAVRAPRPVMLLVPAGSIVDSTLDALLPVLQSGDFVIDAGNSHFRDTERRIDRLKGSGIGFMGMGVSGGERGARLGPAMMAGGDPGDYSRVSGMLEAAAAKYESEPCVGLLGRRSAGHYIKTIHNGIEYAMMQMIAEACDWLQRGQGYSVPQVGASFGKWNKGILAGFLVETTAQVMAFRDEDGTPLVDQILDKAKAKGTGKWTSQDAMDLGVPVPSIDAAVSARSISALKPVRLQLRASPAKTDCSVSPETLPDALLAGFLLAYCQGLSLMVSGSREYGLEIDLGPVCRVWRDGCIIRSGLLPPLAEASDRAGDLETLLLDPTIRSIAEDRLPALREVVVAGAQAGIPMPCFSASLAYFDSLRSDRLPANVTQAQRDYFGAHRFERIDREGSFHSSWGQT